jgi:toxin CcdB
MKQYDVCQASGLGVRGGNRLVLILQHDQLSQLATVVVAPLFTAKELRAIRQLHPMVQVYGQDYVVAIDRLASFPKMRLGDPVANFLSLDYEIRKALDFLFAGC